MYVSDVSVAQAVSTATPLVVTPLADPATDVTAAAPRPVRLFALVALPLLAAWAAFAVVSLSARDGLRDRAEAEARSASRLMARTVATVLDQFSVAASNIATQLHDGSLDGVSPQIGQKLLFGPSQVISSFLTRPFVLDAAGRLRFDAGDPLAMKVSLADRDIFQNAREASLRDPDGHDVIVEPPEAGGLSDEPVLGLAMPLHDASMRFTGVVASGLRTAYLESVFDDKEVTSHGSISLLRTDGVLLARRPAAPDAIGHIYATQPAVRTAIDHPGQRVVARSVVDGIPRLYVSAEVGSYPLRVSVGVSLDALEHGWWRRVAVVTTIMAALTLIVLLLARRTARELATRRGIEDHHRQTVHQLGAANRILEARVASEISARTTSTAEMARGRRLEALGQLAGGFAHEINGVLQAIANVAGLLAGKPRDPANVAQLAGVVLAATDKAAAATRRLSRFARRTPTVAEPVDVADMLSEVKSILQETLGSTIEVAISADPALPHVMADAAVLEAVLIDLAANARDAMPRGGGLTFSATLETATATSLHEVALAPGEYLRISVADTGFGMPMHVLARATDPFFTTQPERTAAGLGLTMARRFAESAGGALGLTSMPDEGTVASIWLPLAAPARREMVPHPADAAPADAARPGRARVLVVDDDSMDRRLLAEALTQAGHTALEAAGAEAALDVLDEEPIDLLLTDRSMAGLDGIALIHTMRRRFGAVPAILLTGDLRLTRGTLQISEPFGLVRKPAAVGDIVKHVDRLLVAARQTA